MATPLEPGCVPDSGALRDPQTEYARAHASHAGEAGYMLLAVIFLMALLLLSLAVAVPRVAAAIQRDREVELVQRGEQYRRAIRLYYKKFGSYPTSIDQLEKTNNIRFLRKRYLDPLTGKDDWKLVLMGQAHVCPLGFFGQPLGMGGSSIAGASTVSNGGFTNGSSSSSSGLGSSAFGDSSAGGSSAFGGSSSSSSGSSFGSSTSGLGSGSSSTGAVGSTGTGCATGAGATGAPMAGAGDLASNTVLGAGSPQGSSTSQGTGLGSSSGSTGSSDSSGLSSGSSTSTSTTLGQGTTNGTGFGAATSTTLGGAPLMGVMPPMNKATIVYYKLKTHYNEWEFDYWPQEEQQGAASLLGGTGNINASGNSVNGPGSGSSGTSGNGFGGSGSSGSGSAFGGGSVSGSGSTGIGNQSGTPQQ